MTPWFIADCPRHVDLCQALRFRGLIEEEGLHAAFGGPIRREIDLFDNLDNVVHILVPRGEEIVGTARLIFSGRETARALGTRHGLPLEKDWDWAPVLGERAIPCEIGRVYVARPHRVSGVPRLVYEAIRQVSRARGATHLVAGATCQTNSAEDAEIMVRVAARRGLMPSGPKVQALGSVPVGSAVEKPFYSDDERRRARQGDLPDRLATTLSTFYKHMSAVLVGAPCLDASFGVFKAPIMAELSTHTADRAMAA